jgi:hypothetical protein
MVFLGCYLLQRSRGEQEGDSQVEISDSWQLDYMDIVHAQGFSRVELVKGAGL